MRIAEEHLYRKESILTPLEQFHIKRPRTDSSTLSLFNHRTSCNGNELEFGCMNYESSEESYIEQILFNEKESIEFDQAWAKFNVEGKLVDLIASNAIYIHSILTFFTVT